jgi:hypothetical protein
MTKYLEDGSPFAHTLAFLRLMVSVMKIDNNHYHACILTQNNNTIRLQSEEK